MVYGILKAKTEADLKKQMQGYLNIYRFGWYAVRFSFIKKFNDYFLVGFSRAE